MICKITQSPLDLKKKNLSTLDVAVLTQLIKEKKRHSFQKQCIWPLLRHFQKLSNHEKRHS